MLPTPQPRHYCCHSAQPWVLLVCVLVLSSLVKLLENSLWQEGSNFHFFCCRPTAATAVALLLWCQVCRSLRCSTAAIFSPDARHMSHSQLFPRALFGVVCIYEVYWMPPPSFEIRINISTTIIKPSRSRTFDDPSFLLRAVNTVEKYATAAASDTSTPASTSINGTDQDQDPAFDAPTPQASPEAARALGRLFTVLRNSCAGCPANNKALRHTGLAEAASTV